jgi:murein DD-endopeptidase MepM/ murein hydrolase activator NlpD
MINQTVARGRLVPILACAVIAMGLLTGGVAIWLGVSSGNESAEATVGAKPSRSTAPVTSTFDPGSEPTTIKPSTAVSTGEATTAVPATEPAPETTPPAPSTFVFPVQSDETHYDSSHHDYPAADMFAPCGTPVVAVTDGTIEEVETVDTYDSSNPDGGTKSGLMAALVDSRGVRYYGSHMLSVLVNAGDRVEAGQQIGTVGETGNAAGTGCHLHFGLSPRASRGGTTVAAMSRRSPSRCLARRQRHRPAGRGLGHPLRLSDVGTCPGSRTILGSGRRRAPTQTSALVKPGSTRSQSSFWRRAATASRRCRWVLRARGPRRQSPQ